MNSALMVVIWRIFGVKSAVIESYEDAWNYRDWNCNFETKLTRLPSERTGKPLDGVLRGSVFCYKKKNDVLT